MKFKFDHDADKLSDVFPEYKIDKKLIGKLHKEILENPHVVLGKKKSHTIQWIQDNQDSAEHMCALSALLDAGLQAMALMEKLHEKTLEEIKKVPKEKLPQEIRDHLYPEDSDKIKPISREVDDAFEKLKTKYK